MIESRRSSSRAVDRIVAATTLLRLTRPQQWVKNAVVLAGLVFAGSVDHPIAILDAVLAMIAFVMASAAIYVFNDIRDVGADRRHPRKRARPLASGEISVNTAVRLSVALAAAAALLGVAIAPALGATIMAYLAMMVSYNLWFKRVPILDVVVIAMGFVLRAIAGAVAIAVPISPWLLLCAFLLALFLGFGKRRAEMTTHGDGAWLHRESLQGYNALLLDQLVRITAMSALVTYATYTVVSSSVPRNDAMLFTVPLVAFAIFRYLYLVYGRGKGESPESLLFRDGWLLGAVLLWGAMALVIVKTDGTVWPFT